MTFNNLVFNDYRSHLVNLFGEQVQKLSIDAGFTCPNRDGSISVGGCTFCNNEKFNPGKKILGEHVSDQIKAQKARIQNRYKNIRKYIAYLQTYSNTYGPINELKELYQSILSNDDIIGIAIGTRIDCVDEEKLKHLENLTKKHYVSIEYGLESISDDVLNSINRGHDFESFEKTIKLTKNRGIKIGVHLMFGLPGDHIENYIKAAKILSSLEVDYVKVHQLQIVRSTIMANQYSKNKFPLLTKREYFDHLSLFLQHLSQKIVIQRLFGDCPKHLLIGPDWNQSSNSLNQEFIDFMQEKKCYQGQLRETRNSN